MRRLHGQCHCGAVRVEIEGIEAADLPLRACQCGFCRRHGALSTSHRLSDYLICAACGCYVGAETEIDGARYAILNVRGVDLPGFDGREPQQMVYDDETPEGRAMRRKAKWSPAALTELQPSA